MKYLERNRGNTTTLLRIGISVLNAMTVEVTENSLTDGRIISVPLAWYPRLVHATPEDRSNWELIGSGEGIHWPDLDEDISVDMLLTGQKSGESQRSLRQWLAAKRDGRGLTLYELTAHEEGRLRREADVGG